MRGPGGWSPKAFEDDAAAAAEHEAWIDAQFDAEVVDAEVVDAKPETRKDRARRLLLEAAVLRVLTDANGKARQEIAAEYDPKDADVASFEGTDLGRVRMDEGRVTCTVTDQAAALAWVEVNMPDQVHDEVVRTITDEGLLWVADNHPDWIVEVVALREVYPAFLKVLVERVKKAKGAWTSPHNPHIDAWVDPATGEQRTDRPPWIAYRQSDPILNVTLSDEAVGVAVRLLAGRLPEIEARA